MKHLIACILTFVCGCATISQTNQVESILTSTKAVCRDEMFKFEISYSDVHMDRTGLKFVETLLHKNEQEEIKITIECSIPLKYLTESKREALTNHGIGKNTLVLIKLPKNIPPSFVKIKRELTGNNGEKQTESNQAQTANCEIYFPDIKTANEWNDKLTEKIKEYSGRN